LDELLEKNDSDLTEEESEFISYYYQRMPVGTHNCVMNRICRRFEEEFDEYFAKNGMDDNFDYSILKSGQEYTASQFHAVEKLYGQYTKRLQEYIQFSKHERIDDDESASKRSAMIHDFKVECQQVCSNGAILCDIIVDLCYCHNGSKQFAWDICGDEIVENLLANNNRIICFPVMNDDGNIVYCGNRFSLEHKEVIL
jgi:hypothetical protein